MSSWYEILYLIGAAILIGFGYFFIKHNPGMFSKANIEKSFSSMGILTVILIAFVALLVYFLKH
ncbi:MAG TPA: hypothetical protein VJK30_01900 [Coxiellaceae bacterium]|nr:MAG: hypothetical protein A3E81_04050 [Gammaproteobacteria bacterium RIFCSPHIGHO2_12_FULL_36_30]HLB56073.1 hypothetical protein [Coxiellaceae bacterium]